MPVRKKTENQKAFEKERRRLLRAVRRAEKKGYIFSKDIVPVRPKRVTKKAIERIKSIKPKDLYNMAEYYPTISIIDTIRDRLDKLQRVEKPQVDISVRKNEILNIFDDTVTFYDMNDNLSEYENYLKEHETEIADLLDVIAYDSDVEKINASFVWLGRLLNVTALSMEQAENLSAMAEYYNE